MWEKESPPPTFEVWVPRCVLSNVDGLCVGGQPEAPAGVCLIVRFCSCLLVLGPGYGRECVGFSWKVPALRICGSALQTPRNK